VTATPDLAILPLLALASLLLALLACGAWRLC